jgi:predicted GNAT family acetyltransferase
MAVRELAAGIVRPMESSGSADRSSEAIETVDRPDRSRYEITVDGRVAGVAIYALGDGEIKLLHTEVDRAFAGRGMGSRLAADVLDDIRARGLRVRAECPFMARYIRSHPAYQDLGTP